MTHRLKDYINVLVVLIFGGLVAIAGSHNGISFNGIPILVICFIASFLIHWVAFIPAYYFRTEKFYDITGTIAYLLILTLASLLTFRSLNEPLHTRSVFILILVTIWALRLGVFLFIRVLKAGEDQRFREPKQNFSIFLVWWNTSALWVFLTSVNALTMIINNVEFCNDLYFYVGIFLWLIGFVFETIADDQKRRFKKDLLNKDKFISTGLWSISRHPNYFGEILLWSGIAIISLPTLQGWQFVTLISPIFIFLLLTKVSGINLLEDIADERWGGELEYDNYKKNTPMLVPFIKNDT